MNNSLLTTAGRFPAVFYALAAGAGALSHFAFAPYDHSWLLPLCLTSLLLLSQQRSPKQGFLLGLSWGFGQFILGLRWVHVSIAEFGGLPLFASLGIIVLLALYLALYPALVIALLNRYFSSSLFTRTLAFAPLWLLAEVLRGWMLTGFPWLWSGYSQVNGLLANMAPIVGTLGIGFIISLVASCLAALYYRQWRYVMPLALIACLPWSVSKDHWIQATGASTDVALVQGNIAQSMKWEPDQLWPTIMVYHQLSLAHFDADLIIWPEAAMPIPETYISDYLRQMERGVADVGGHLITGIISMDEQQQFYNSLLVLDQMERAMPYSPLDENRYHKHQLLPIGEFVPFESLLRPLAPLFNLPMSSFHRGAAIQPNLTAGDHHIAPAICYEIAFPELVRNAITEHTDLLLTVSNDAWFGESIGPSQHMAIAQMRALELGKPLLRVTNNGITAVVGANGQIQAKLPQFTADVLRQKVALVRGITPFARYGQWPLYLLSLFMLCAAYGFSLRTQKAMAAPTS